MSLMATKPITVPQRILDRWYVTQLQLQFAPDGKIAVSYVATRGDASGPSTETAQRYHQRVIGDLAALFINDKTSTANIATAAAALEALVAADMTQRKVL